MASPILSSARAASYVRMSSGAQEKSPAQQRSEVAKLADREGCNLIREYFDSAISGDDAERRLGFQAMHKAACKGEFDTILCWDFSRFGRFNSLEAGYWIHPLVKAGVRLVAEGAVNWQDFTGRIVNAVYAEGKHQFLLDLSRNALRGMVQRVQAGGNVGVPFGYQRDGNSLAIDPVEAPIVRRIFAEYHKGASLRGIANRLNADCIPSPSGTTWAMSAVRQILIRQKYTGAGTWGGNNRGEYFTSNAGEITASGSNGAAAIITPHAHPAIVDATVFQAAQTRLAGNQKRTAPNRTYLLSGLLRCGCCGSSMAGTRNSRRSESNRSYRCCGYQHHGLAKCTNNAIDESTLVAAIVRKIQMEAFAPDKLKKLRAAIKRQLEVVKQPAGDTKAIAKQLAAAEAKVNAAADKILEAPKSIAGTLYSRLEKLQTERDTLRAALEAAERPDRAQGDQQSKLAELALDSLWQLSRAIGKANGDELRHLLQTAIEGIELRFKPIDGSKRTECVGGVVTVKQPAEIFYLDSSRKHGR